MARLIEVWGDTVDAGQMGKAVGLGVGVAAPAFLGAKALLGRVVDEETLASSYALLVGLAACLLAGYLAARWFPPKRTLRETVATDDGRRAALEEVAEEGGAWTDPSRLPADVQQELRELDLYDLLMAAHARAQDTETPAKGARP